jgi:hypothetical protein
MGHRGNPAGGNHEARSMDVDVGATVGHDLYR